MIRRQPVRGPRGGGANGRGVRGHPLLRRLGAAGAERVTALLGTGRGWRRRWARHQPARASCWPATGDHGDAHPHPGEAGSRYTAAWRDVWGLSIRSEAGSVSGVVGGPGSRPAGESVSSTTHRLARREVWRARPRGVGAARTAVPHVDVSLTVGVAEGAGAELQAAPGCGSPWRQRPSELLADVHLQP